MIWTFIPTTDKFCNLKPDTVGILGIIFMTDDSISFDIEFDWFYLMAASLHSLWKHDHISAWNMFCYYWITLVTPPTFYYIGMTTMNLSTRNPGFSFFFFFFFLLHRKCVSLLGNTELLPKSFISNSYHMHYSNGAAEKLYNIQPIASWDT